MVNKYYQSYPKYNYYQKKPFLSICFLIVFKINLFMSSLFA